MHDLPANDLHMNDLPAREIRLPLDQLVSILRDLNEFVVSLDRLGSRQAAGTADARTVGEFVADWDVARRLARARQLLGVALDEQLTPEENALVDELCEQGRFFGARPADAGAPGPRRRPVSGPSRG
ncbi:hypothetical protein [Streptomyces sp. Y1]|uniref:Uncharacterized protein n=1 Tax=Streptomyces sp. Y1 TaxID=3238634 RepID=A0AB39TSC7_9ACTN